MNYSTSVKVFAGFLLLTCQLFAVDLYVAPTGSDANPGTIGSPFKTLTAARDALRTLKATTPLTNGANVWIRGGIHEMPYPLYLTTNDSGLSGHPIRYVAYPGETPILTGGRAITNWVTSSNGLWNAQTSWGVTNAYANQMLIVDGVQKVRARHPNFDTNNPTTGGYNFVRPTPNFPGNFGSNLRNTQNAGTWVDYSVSIPTNDTFTCWYYYAASFGDASGKTALIVDGGAPVILQTLPDNAGTYTWKSNAVLTLTAGTHTIRWTNMTGGIYLQDAFALTDDPAWTPVTTSLPSPAAGKFVVVVQSEIYTASSGSPITTSLTYDPLGKTLSFNVGDLYAWPASSNKVLNIFVFEGGLCANSHANVTNIDEAGQLLSCSARIANAAAELGARYFVDNVYEALDTPTEWFLNKTTGILTYWPDIVGFETNRSEMPVLGSLIELNPATTTNQVAIGYLEFSGLTFTCTGNGAQQSDWTSSSWAAIWLRQANNVLISSNKFLNLGGTAIVITGNSSSNSIVLNEIHDCGAGGITINGDPNNAHNALPVTGQPSQYNTVSGNHIYNTGKTFKHGNPIHFNSSQYNTIAYNRIHDVPRAGISGGRISGGNVMAFNEIARNCLETGDTGGIYLYNIQEADANVISNNVVTQTVGVGTTVDGVILTPYYVWNIYLDGETSNTRVENNVCVQNTRGGVFFNGGHSNIVQNNLLVGGTINQVEYSNWTARDTNNVFRHNLMIFTDQTAQYFASTAPAGVTNLDTDYNILWRGGPAPTIYKYSNWRASGKFDQHTVTANPAVARTNLIADSPAQRAGFKPIDVSKVGPQGYQ